MRDSTQEDGNDHERQEVKKNMTHATIVGGRPPGSGSRGGDFPHGIEVLVKKASVDREFRKVFLEKRAEAAREIDLALSPAEVATLSALPRAQMEQIIEKTTVPDEHRRIFLGKMAAAMLAVIGLGLSGEGAALGKRIVRGTRPDEDGPRPAVTDVRPDVPQRPERLKPLRVDPRSDRLHIGIVDEGTNSTSVKVRFECPFERGEVRIFLRKNRTSEGASLVYQPTRAPVSRGTGEVTFTVSGDNGTTEWLVAELWSTAFQCRPSRSSLGALPPRYKPGEFVINNCVVVRLVRHHKAWSRE